MIHELKSALGMLKNYGWSGPGAEPLCADENGAVCLEENEGVSVFSVEGAMRLSGCWPDGEDALEAVVAPEWHAVNRLMPRVADAPSIAEAREYVRLCKRAAPTKTLREWLKEPTRTKDDVLRAFVRAIQRSKKHTGERRHGG